MRPHGTFLVPRPETLEDSGVTPGGLLAHRLAAALARRGLDVNEPEDFDFAWSVLCALDGHRWEVLIGLVGSEGEQERWLASAEPLRTGLLRRKRPSVDELTPYLHAVLVEDIGVAPRWCTEQEWNGPAFGDGAEDPLAPTT